MRSSTRKSKDSIENLISWSATESNCEGTDHDKAAHQPSGRLSMDSATFNPPKIQSRESITMKGRESLLEISNTPAAQGNVLLPSKRSKLNIELSVEGAKAKNVEDGWVSASGVSNANLRTMVQTTDVDQGEEESENMSACFAHAKAPAKQVQNRPSLIKAKRQSKAQAKASALETSETEAVAPETQKQPARRASRNTRKEI